MPTLNCLFFTCQSSSLKNLAQWNSSIIAMAPTRSQSKSERRSEEGIEKWLRVEG
jgi:hypothetical protein